MTDVAAEPPAARWRSAWLWPALFAAGLVAIRYGEVLTGRRVLLARDLAAAFHPSAEFIAHALREGRFPLWNPYAGCGEPFFALAMPGVLYPPHWLYAVVPLDALFSRLLVAHLVLAALFAVGLVRELGGGRPGAAAAAAAVSLGGVATSLVPYQASLFACAWLPASAWAGLRAMRTGRVLPALLAGAALCPMALTGGFEVLAMAAALLALVAAAPGAFPGGPPAPPPLLGRRLLLLGVALGVALALGAVQIVPFAEMARLSYRSRGLPADESLLWSVPPRDLLHLLVPDAVRRDEPYWDEQNLLRVIYLGIVPVHLAALFFARAGRRGLGLLATFGVGLLFSLGGNLPGYAGLADLVPLMAAVRYPAKFLIAASFAAAVAAGLGLDAPAAEPMAERRARAILLGVAAAWAALLVATLVFGDPLRAGYRAFAAAHRLVTTPEVFLHNLRRVCVLGGLGSLALAASRWRPEARAAARLILPALVAVDVIGSAPLDLHLRPPRPPDEVPSNVQTARADPGFDRVFSPSSMWELVPPSFDGERWMWMDRFLPNTLMPLRLFNVQDFRVLTPDRVDAVIATIEKHPQPGATRLLDLVGARYLVWPTEVTSAGYTLLRAVPDHRLVKNAGALPRAFLVDAHRTIADPEKLLAAMEDPAWNPERLVLLEREPPPAEVGDPAPGDRVRIASYQPERVVIEAAAAGPRFLVVTDTWYPGWTATVDGRPASILRADLAFRAVVLGPGRHEIQFRYAPTSVVIGGAISAAALAGLCAAAGIRRIRRRSASAQGFDLKGGIRATSDGGWTPR